MPYEVTQESTKARNRRPINIHQNGFAKAYISTTANSRRPIDSVSDALNMELVQDNIWRPRPATVRYGTQSTNAIIGRGKYRYNGVRGELFMINDAGVGKVYSRVDGGAFTLIGGVNAYSPTGWAGFVQAKNRVYVYNSTNNLTYVNLATMATVEYTTLATPAAPTHSVSAALASSPKYKYYYKVTANNTVGESTASPASAVVDVNDLRENWTKTASKTVTVNWTSVAGASAYTIYGGTDPLYLYEIITLVNPTTLSFEDDNTITLSPYKTAPASNSTQGAIFTYMYVDVPTTQVYGTTIDNKLYYSAPGAISSGDFSALNGGGYLTIDEGGDSLLNFVDGFRTGKGDPVITASTKASAGKGRLNHITFQQLSYGDQVFFVPNVVEANGQSGTYAPRATVKSGDSLIYPTGDAIKTTGTSQNINNILTTGSLTNGIVPDINRIRLSALHKAAGVEYQDKVYFALPVDSDENSELWVLDRARKDVWTLRWTVAAKDIWLYEDNAGGSHLCVLVNNVILEFTRVGSQTTTDDGVAFPTRLAFSSLVWDEDGISLGNIHNQYFKLLEPRGVITASTTGLGKRGVTVNTGDDSFDVEVTFTGIGVWDYSGDYQYGGDVGMITDYAANIAVLHVRPKGLINQEDWEVTTEDANCDYLLSSVSTRGMSNLDLVYRGIS